MAVLRLKLDAVVVNAPIPDFPFAARREFAEAAGFEYDQVTGGGAVAIPTTQIGAITALILQSDKAVTVAMGSIALEPGGVILIYGGVPATSPPTVTNASGATAKVRGLALGS